MKTKIWMVVICHLMTCIGLNACDICGSNANISGLGWIHLAKRNSIGLSWSYNRFHSVHSEGLKDVFQTFELQGIYHLGSRWKFQAQIPFQLNSRLTRSVQSTLNGLGDVRLSTHYKFVQKEFANGLGVYLDGGLGLNIPTGSYSEALHDRNLPVNFNPGGGACAMLFEPALALSYYSMGLLISGSYLKKFQSASGFRFGDQTSFQTLLFTEFAITNTLKGIPIAGVQFERLQPDILASGVSSDGTGGKSVLIPIGMNIKNERAVISANYFLPIYQSYSGGDAKLLNKFSVRISYFI